MTIITIDRATVEQAADELEKTIVRTEARQATINNLRAALAQQAEPVEPVAWEVWWLHHGQHNYRAKPLTSERVKELMKLAFEVGREATLPQQAEPVADPFNCPKCGRHDYGLHGACPTCDAQQAEPVEPVAVFDARWGQPVLLSGAPLLEDEQPLYTAPPQRKPLTDEKISDLWCEVSNTDFVTADTHVFARAVERAHGIKE